MFAVWESQGHKGGSFIIPFQGKHVTSGGENGAKEQVVQFPRLRGMQPLIFQSRFLLAMAPPPLQEKCSNQKQLIWICENNRLLVM